MEQPQETIDRLKLAEASYRLIKFTSMDVSLGDMRRLIAEIERLTAENAMLKADAGCACKTDGIRVAEMNAVYSNETAFEVGQRVLVYPDSLLISEYKGMTGRIQKPMDDDGEYYVEFEHVSVFDYFKPHELSPAPASRALSPSEQTRIDVLKRNWLQDPIWDIEETEGFEEYQDELKAFRLEHEAGWKASQEADLYVFQENLGINREAAMCLRNLQRRLERLEQANE